MLASNQVQSNQMDIMSILADIMGINSNGWENLKGVSLGCAINFYFLVVSLLCILNISTRLLKYQAGYFD